MYPDVNNTGHSIYSCLHWRAKYRCSFPLTPQHLHMHTHEHDWNDGTAATARGVDADKGGSVRLLHLTLSTTLASPFTPSRPRAIRGCSQKTKNQRSTTKNPQQPITPSRLCTVQTTPAHLHWCRTNPPGPWPSQAAAGHAGRRIPQLGSHFLHFRGVFIKRVCVTVRE